MLDQLHLQIKSERWPVRYIFALLLVVGACTGSEVSTMNQRSGGQQENKDQKKTLKSYEASFDPSPYREELETIKKAVTLPSVLPTELAAKDTVIIEEQAIQGFRIQIFATSSIDEANFLKSTASLKITEDSIYVVYDPPVYRVRVGDFATRFEANQKLPSIVSKGYTDAWVVADRIIRRKFVRVSRDELVKQKQ